MRCHLCLESFDSRKTLNQHVRTDHKMSFSEEFNFVTPKSSVELDPTTSMPVLDEKSEDQEHQLVPVSPL